MHVSAMVIMLPISPVPIEFFVYDYNPAGNPYAFDNALNGKLLEVIRKHAKSKPTIIFNATRRGAVTAAKAIFDGINRLNLLNQFVTSYEQQEQLNRASEKFNEHIKEFIRVGIGVHHGGQRNAKITSVCLMGGDRIPLTLFPFASMLRVLGMDHKERQIVENLFSSEHIRVVCATSTLGQGVNFPAFCAIIKGTQHWNGSQMSELDQSTVMQMIGRAGRPQFDSSGVAVILTTSDKLHLYKGILVGRIIESQLKERMIEHLGAECAASANITTEQCVQWTRSTFMYTRMHKKPSQYFGRQMSPAQINEQVDLLTRNCVQRLLDASMLEPESDQFTSFRALPLVTLMSRWYLQFNTAKSFNNIKPNTTFRGLLRLFAQADEFKGSEFRVKAGDKGTLKPFMATRRRRSVAPTQMVLNDSMDESDSASQQDLVCLIPYPTDSKTVTDVADKIQVLVQLKCLGLEETGDSQKIGFELKQEINSIMGPGSRVARAMDDFVQAKAERCMQAGGDRAGLETEPHTSGLLCGWVALKSAIAFRRCIDKGVFENVPHMFAQLKSGIGIATARKLYHEFRTFDDLKEWGAERIVSSLGKGIKVKALQGFLDDMPTYTIETEQTKYDGSTQSAQVTIDFRLSSQIKNAYMHHCHLIVGTLRHELLFWRKVKLSELPTTIEVQVDRGTHLKAFILDDRWVGRDVSDVVMVRYEELHSGINPVKFAELKAKLERRFRDLEIAEQEKQSGQGETNPKTETAAIVEYESNSNAFQEDIYLSTLTKTTACKHQYPKCLTAECKHRCCYERATNNYTKPLPDKPQFDPPSLLEVAARRFASQDLDATEAAFNCNNTTDEGDLNLPFVEPRRGFKRTNEWINSAFTTEPQIENSNRLNTRQTNPYAQALQDQLSQPQSTMSNKRLRLPAPATPLTIVNNFPTPMDATHATQTPTPVANSNFQHLAELFDDDTAVSAKEQARMQEIRRKRYDATASATSRFHKYAK